MMQHMLKIKLKWLKLGICKESVKKLPTNKHITKKYRIIKDNKRKHWKIKIILIENYKKNKIKIHIYINIYKQYKKNCYRLL